MVDGDKELNGKTSSNMTDEKKESISQAFHKVLKKIDERRLKGNELEHLNSLELFEPLKKRNWSVYIAFYVAILATFFGGFFYNRLHTVEGMNEFILNYYGVFGDDIQHEMCTIEMPDVVIDVFRPPAKCDMCKGMKEVPKVTKITQSDFEKLHAYSGRPVVIVDGTKNWTAPQVFSYNFFKELYPEDSPVMGDMCQFFPYKTSFQSLQEVFTMSEDRANLKDGSKPWYIGWSNCDQDATDILRKHYERPYFLPPESESSKTDWIFMGSPGYGANMHIDHVGNPSWQAQIKGRKRWTLQPPPECFRECQTMDVTVNPGEIIVVDTNVWFHKTLVLGDGISITIGSEYD